MPVATSVRMPAMLAAAALALAACATDSDPDDSADPAGQDVDAAVEETTEPAEETPTEVTITTAQGEATVPFRPQRVIVVEHGILDTIDYLGAGESVVGIPHHAVPSYLADYTTSTENTGTLFEPDYEAINAAEPDLIIVGGRSAATLPAMEAIAPTIDLSFGWGSEAFMTTFETNTTALGQIFGAEDEAAAALAEVTAGAQAVAADAADEGPGLVLMTSAGEVSAYGPSEEGRFDFVYNLLGVEPAIDQVAIDDHGDAISFEFIAEVDPSLLIVLDRDAAIGEEGEAAQAVLDNELVNSTTAVANDNVLYVDTEKWYLSFGGLTSVNTILDEVGSLVS
ncbi:siderophore ABC transporter substrate-binding protein [Demequina activiva]|uniref:ABC transporter substrate-binding protein n=1 Tax=Demequina activiva TaxID=1582364 RepID=A0A919UJ00_9MICO|nr:ABC transporter substrate-binding protein [Demequina activiva]GIG53876.1 ABC transporter substrate-binding protein [Demequina activiva]